MKTKQQAGRRPGRPRNPQTHQSILQATRDLLLQLGYHNLTIEGVASKSGASRATVYRWWPSKVELVLEATEEHISIGTVPDTGETRKDLLIAIKQITDTFSDPLASIVIFADIAKPTRDLDLSTPFRNSFVFPWRHSAAEAIERGVTRGDLPAGTDVSFVLNTIVGTVFQHTMVAADADLKVLATNLVELFLGSPTGLPN